MFRTGMIERRGPYNRDLQLNRCKVEGKWLGAHENRVWRAVSAELPLKKATSIQLINIFIFNNLNGAPRMIKLITSMLLNSNYKIADSIEQPVKKLIFVELCTQSLVGFVDSCFTQSRFGDRRINARCVGI